MKYEAVFRPGKPIRERHFLLGRDQELSDLRKYYRRPGLHPLVIGNRGVGKTSVVIQAFAHISPPLIRIGCTPQLTFQRLAQFILRGLGFDTDSIESSHELNHTY